MASNKPKLSLDEQIEHLKRKGVLFNIMDEAEAKEYLKNNNNYFKLTAYRKNYSKHPGGENKGKYINLEFAYLVDIAVIDMRLRYQIVQMALDIEHHARLHLLRKIDQYGEDGYRIVDEYIKSLEPKQKHILDGEINRSRASIYCQDIVNKYDGAYPVWVFIEIVSFGRFVGFYKFCADKFSDKVMMDKYYNLLTCKRIRNAAAHNNCILNDLKTKTAANATNKQVTDALVKIGGIKKKFRQNRMSNARIQQIVTLLYVHKDLVESAGLRQSESENLQKIKDRMYKHIDYYQGNNTITSTFNFLKTVIDNWFEME